MPLIVNGKPIDDAVLEGEFAGIKSYHERLGNISCCERDPEFRATAKDNIIARVLLTEEARRTIPERPAAEVDAAYERVKEQHGGEPQFLAAVGAFPEQIPIIRHDIEMELRVNKMLDDLCSSETQPTETQMRAYYEKNISQFQSEEQVRASHISKAPPRGENRQATFDLFRDMRQRLLEGADFDELAREHSDRGKELIDLGFFHQGELPMEFDLVAFSMNVGEISPVFGSSVGYHIIKVTDKKPAAPTPFDEAKPEIRRRLLEERRGEKTRELVDRLKQTAVIEDTSPENADAVPQHAHAS